MRQNAPLDLGLKILPTGLGFKVPQNAPFYTTETNEKDPKFKVGDHVRISKYKNIFAKGHAPNWSEKIFVVKKTHVISDLNGKEIVGSF